MPVNMVLAAVPYDPEDYGGLSDRQRAILAPPGGRAQASSGPSSQLDAAYFNRISLGHSPLGHSPCN
jgi:hypothetical protein